MYEISARLPLRRSCKKNRGHISFRGPKYFAKFREIRNEMGPFVSFRFVSFSSEYMVSYFVSFRLSSQDAFHLIKPDQIFR